MFDRILNKISPFRVAQREEIRRLSSEVEAMQLLLGKIAANTISGEKINDFEFKVFSQWGDDGIIQFLINNVDVSSKSFIEFGVENYRESNTRFLLNNNNWRGLIIDGSKEHVDYIKRQNYQWKYNLSAVNSFITKENINSIISSANFAGEVGLLSVDIDGNDYWIWKEISVVRPDIVIVEYNSAFGFKHEVSVPYKPDFHNTTEHYSNLYFGCSLLALAELGKSKGYSLVACNSNGNNAYFVRNEKIGKLKVLSVEDAYVDGMFRQSRNSAGELTFLSGHDRLMEIKDMPLINLKSSEKIKVRDLLGQ